MKNENNNLNLEQLLAAVEHDGRDARRQRELGEMIDRMAEGESRKRGKVVRLWTTRIAAAACVTFFIVTAVRIWFIPTGGGTLVAEAESGKVKVESGEWMETVAPSLQTASTVNSTHVPALSSHARNASAIPLPRVEEEVEISEYEEEAVIEEPVVIEDYVAEAIEPETEEDVAVTVDEIAAPIVSVEPPTKPVAQDTAAKEQPRRSMLASLFHRAAPSRMDGTVLAFNLL